MENPTAPPRGTHRKWGLRVGCKEHGRQRPRSLVSRPQQSSLYWALKCILQITRSAILVPIVLAQLLEPPCTDPYARWCGRGGAARLPPIPINLENEIASFRGSRPRKLAIAKPPSPKKLNPRSRTYEFFTGDYLARWIDSTSFAATKAASVRLRTPNARKSAAVWLLLVPSAIFNRRAMSLLDMPRDKSGRISLCLGVNLTVSNSPLAGGEIWLFPS